MGNAVRQVEGYIRLTLLIYGIVMCGAYVGTNFDTFMIIAFNTSILAIIIMIAMIATLLIERPMTSLALLLAGILSGPAIVIYFFTRQNICREIAEYGRELDTDFFLWRVRTAQRFHFPKF